MLLSLQSDFKGVKEFVMSNSVRIQILHLVMCWVAMANYKNRLSFCILLGSIKNYLGLPGETGLVSPVWQEDILSRSVLWTLDLPVCMAIGSVIGAWPKSSFIKMLFLLRTTPSSGWGSMVSRLWHFSAGRVTEGSYALDPRFSTLAWLLMYLGGLFLRLWVWLV